MKKLLLILIIFTQILSVYSQTNEFNTSDLRRVINIVGFKGVKTLKNFTDNDLIVIFSKIESDRAFMAQLNINSWGVCDHYKINNFDLFNYYYLDITRTTYNTYCKELNALMLLDGTIDQLK
jgi:hypothetical protein